jgi:hypothetical protein
MESLEDIDLYMDSSSYGFLSFNVDMGVRFYDDVRRDPVGSNQSIIIRFLDSVNFLSGPASRIYLKREE